MTLQSVRRLSRDADIGRGALYTCRDRHSRPDAAIDVGTCRHVISYYSNTDAAPALSP